MNKHNNELINNRNIIFANSSPQRALWVLVISYCVLKQLIIRFKLVLLYQIRRINYPGSSEQIFRNDVSFCSKVLSQLTSALKNLFNY